MASSLGGPVGGVRDTGGVQKSYFRPFGEFEQVGGGLTPYLFTDQEHDAESGLQYFGARYYDPWIGRFLEQDPELISPHFGISFGRIRSDPQQFNAYSYARNAPTVFTDPTGAFAYSHEPPARPPPDFRPYGRAPFFGVEMHGGGRGGSGAPVQVAAALALPYLIYVVVAPPLAYWWVTVGAPTVNEMESGGGDEDVSDHAEESKGDPAKSVGDADQVVREGTRYADRDTGYDVFVKGDKVVIKDGPRQVTEFRNPRKNTNRRIAEGKWIPKP